MPNEEDRKWLYGQFKDNGYDTGSYDDFVKSLDNDEDFEWWHKEATSLGLEVGDLKEFGSLFRTPKEEPVLTPEDVALSDEPDLRPLNEEARLRAEQNARKEAEEQARRERMANVAEGRAMFDRMREKKAGGPTSRISDAPQRAKDAMARSEVAEKARQEQKSEDVQRFGTGAETYSADDAAYVGRLYEDVSAESEALNKDIEQYNKTGKGNFTELNERQRNLRQRTDELRKSPAWKEYLDLSDRYNTLSAATETPEIRLEKARLAAELSRNPIARVGMGAEAPSESQINFDTNRAEADFIESQMETADRAQKKEYKARLKELNREVLDNDYYQADVARRIAENDAEREDVYKRMTEIRQEVMKDKSKLETLDDALLAEPEYQKLLLASSQLEQTGRKLAHIRDKNAGDFWVNFMDVFSDPNTYNFGITNLETALATKAAQVQTENDYMSPSADGAVDLLSAVAGGNAVSAEEGKYVEGKGKYGQIAAQSIPFMLQIGLTGGFGNVANAVSGKVTKALGDKFLVKATGAALGDLAAGFVSANTIGGAKTMTDILNNYYGTLVSDGDGGFKYEGGQGLGRSVWGAEVGNTLEYASERAGDHMQHLLGRSILGWGIKSAQKNGRGTVNLAVEELAKTMDVTLKDFGFRSANQAGANWAQKAMGGMFKALNQMGVQGLPFEVAEEYVGLLGNIILGGEEKWMDFSKLGDKETHTDIWGGMLYSIGLTQAGAVAMGGVGAGVNGIRKAQAYHQLENALEVNSNIASTLLGENEWKGIKETIDGTTNKELPKKVVEYMNNKEYDPQQRAAILDYVKNTYLFRGFNAGTIAQARERLTSEDNLKSLNINAEAASAQDQISDAYMLGYQQSTAKRAEVEQADLDRNSRRSAMDAIEQREEIEQAVARQKSHLLELTLAPDVDENYASMLLDDENADPELRDAALGYLMAAAVERGFDDAENNRQLRGKALIEGRLKQQYGKFYYEDPFGGSTVETSQTPNPATKKWENIFLLSGEPNENGEVPFVSLQTGRRGYVKREQIAEYDGAGNIVPGLTKTQSLNDFLDEQYAYEQAQREAGLAQQDAEQTAQRQVAENQQAQQGFREAVEGMEDEDGAFNYNGKRGRLIRKTDMGAVFEPEDGSDNVELTWEQLAQGTEMPAAEEPAAEPEAAEAPAEAPAEEPAEETPKIPLDKDGNPIYDAPGVSVEDALADMYTTEGLDEADVDDYIINRAAEAEKGRAVKQGKMSLREWGAKKKEANRIADFWGELAKFAEENKSAREKEQKEEAARQALIEKYGVDTSKFDLTPQTAEEAVADYLAGEKLINLDDAIRETLGRRKDNRIPSELFRHLGAHGILTKKGGLSVADVARDIVGEYGDTVAIDEDEARDLIINMLVGKTKSEIRDTIFNNRLEQARKEQDMFQDEGSGEKGPQTPPAEAPKPQNPPQNPPAAPEKPEGGEKGPAAPEAPKPAGEKPEGQKPEGQREKGGENGGEKPGNAGNNGGNSVPLGEGKPAGPAKPEGPATPATPATPAVPGSLAEIKDVNGARAFYEAKFGKGKKADKLTGLWEKTHPNTGTAKASAGETDSMARALPEGLSEEAAHEIEVEGVSLAVDLLEEDGLVKYKDFFKFLVENLGDNIRPFVASVYLGAKARVDKDVRKQMDTEDTVYDFDENIDLNDIDNEQDDTDIQPGDSAGADTVDGGSEGEGGENVPGAGDDGRPAEGDDGAGENEGGGAVAEGPAGEPGEGTGEHGSPADAGEDNGGSPSDGGRGTKRGSGQNRGRKRGSGKSEPGVGRDTGGEGTPGVKEVTEAEKEAAAAREEQKAYDEEKERIKDETDTNKLKSLMESIKEKLTGITDKFDLARAKLAGQLRAIQEKLRDLFKSNIKKAEALAQEKVPYESVSDPAGTHTIGSVVPSAAADALREAIKRVEKEVGKPIANFVQEELGYESLDDMFTGEGKDIGLSGEQVDAVGLAIYQIKTGKMLIVGDMTGVGKGRVGAALIRWGKKNGKKVLFVTEQPNLFTTMYEDINDIGGLYRAKGDKSPTDAVPWIVNDDAEANITEVDDNDVKTVLVPHPNDAEMDKLYDSDTDELPVAESGRNKAKIKGRKYDFVMMTYSQGQAGTEEEEGDSQKVKKKNLRNTKARRKLKWIQNYAKDAVVIMDESHKASGQSARGGYFQSIAEVAQGVCFMSATFAKTPSNMVLYAIRSSMGEAMMTKEQLIAAINDYGLPMQEILASALFKTGEMVRRERDFEGVKINWPQPEDIYTEEEIKTCRDLSDKTTGVINAIIDFQRRFVNAVIKKMNEPLKEQNEKALFSGQKDIYVSEYASVPYSGQVSNVVGMMLFAIKAKKAADMAIEQIKRGEKPVIAVDNTLGAYIDSIEGDIESADFGMVLRKGLATALKYQLTRKHLRWDDKEGKYKEVKGDRNTEKYDSIAGLLGENGIAEMENLENLITDYGKETLGLDLSLSPIDYIKNRIRKAGYKIGEITKRKNELVQNPDGTWAKRAIKHDKKGVIRKFNGGKAKNPIPEAERLDAIIMNRSGATGNSLHASRRFGDQKPRKMIILQPAKDSSEEVQIRGRIDRTGQVQRGEYFYIMSPIPAEKKIIMMLRQKLASLDANSVGSEKVESNRVEAEDMDNKYGDEVAKDFLVDHPEINEQLDANKRVKQKVKKDGTTEWTGHPGLLYDLLIGMQRMTCAEQELVLSELEESYAQKIEYLNQNGINDLTTTTMDLEAETKDTAIMIKGRDNNSISEFAHDTTIERVEVNVLRKQLHTSDVHKKMRELGAEKSDGTPVDYYDYGESFQQKAREAVASLIAAKEEKQREAEESLLADLRVQSPQMENETDEQYEKRLKEFAEYTDLVAKNEKDLNNYRTTFENQLITLRRATRALKAGWAYLVPLNDSENADNRFGRFLGFKAGKDGRPKSVEAVFATKDSRAMVSIPIITMDKVMKRIIDNSGGFLDAFGKSSGEYASDEERVKFYDTRWDKMVSSTSARQLRYMITGNILQACSVLGSHRGMITTFTRRDPETGEITIDRGMLLAEDFDPENFVIRERITKDEVWDSSTEFQDELHGITAHREGDKVVIKFRKLDRKDKLKDHKILKDEEFKQYCDGGSVISYSTEELRAVISEGNVEAALNHLYENYGFTQGHLLVMPDSADKVDRIVFSGKSAQDTIAELQPKHRGVNSGNIDEKVEAAVKDYKMDVGNEELKTRIRELVQLRQAWLRESYTKEGDAELAWDVIMYQQEADDRAKDKPGETPDQAIERKQIRQKYQNVAEACKEELAFRGFAKGHLKHFKQGKVDFSEMEKTFKEFNTDKQNGELAKKVFAIVKKLNLDVFMNEKLRDSEGGNTGGRVMNFNWHFMNEEFIPDQLKANTILHESIHTVTAYAFRLIDYGNEHLMPQELTDIANELKSIYDIVSVNPNTFHQTGKYEWQGYREYGCKNVKEMLSEAGSNPGFRNALSKIKMGVSVKFGVVSLIDVTNSPNYTGRTENALEGVYSRLEQMIDQFNEHAYVEAFRGTSVGDRDYSERELQRRGENLRNPIDRAAAIVKIGEIAKKLGVKFKEDPDLKAKGVFNPKTGEIRINIDAHKDTADLEATLLHEAVAHYGLRNLFKEDWPAVRKKFYEQATDGIKAKVDALAKQHGLSKEVAMEEYIASLAEDGRFDQEEETFWQKVVNAIKRILHKIGFNAGRLTDDDFRALLYASFVNMRDGGPIESAAKISTYQALRKMASASHEDNGPDDDGPDGGGNTPTPTDGGLNRGGNRAENFRNWFGNSKVVDENGEPLMVYHGSRSTKDFSVFDYDAETDKATGSGEKPAFFFSDEQTANVYKANVKLGTLYEGEGRMFPVYLSLQNPLEIDYEGANFRGVGLLAERYNYLTKKWEPMTNNGLRYFPNEGEIISALRRRYPNRKFDIDVDYRFTKVNAKPPIGEFVDGINRDEYDGAIVRNIDEVGGITTDYVAFNPNQIKSATDNNGNFSTEDPDIYHRFIGEGGATRADVALGPIGSRMETVEVPRTGLAKLFGSKKFKTVETAIYRTDNLRLAKEMQAEGVEPADIKRATGWEQGKDGEWRYEESDVRLNEELYEQVSKMPMEERRDKKFEISEVLVHDKAYDALMAEYPELTEIQVQFYNDSFFDIFNATRGYYNPKTKTLMLNPSAMLFGDKPTAEDLTSVVVHELQHVIQGFEGFASGGNTSIVDKYGRVGELRQRANETQAKLDATFESDERYRQVKDELDRKENEYSDEYIAWQRKRDEEDAEYERQRKEYEKTFDAAWEKFEKDSRELTKKRARGEISWNRYFEMYDELERERDKSISPFPRQLASFSFFTGRMRKYSFEDLKPLRDKLYALKNLILATNEEAKALEEEKKSISSEIKDEQYRLYQSIAGEVEARNVQKRMNMTDEERRNSLAESTEDVQRTEQILLADEDASEAMSLSSLPDDIRKDVEDLETDQETEVLYRRASNSATAQTAAEMYGDKVRTIRSAVKEVLVDEMAPVDTLMEALATESGTKIKDDERVSDMMRETGGKAMQAIREYDKKFLQPMWSAVGEFRKKTGTSIKDTETYIGLKSGLERNIVLAKRDAKRDYQAEYDAEIDEINQEEKTKKKALDKQLKAGTISDVTYQGELTLLQQEMKQKRDDAANKLNGHFADVDAGTDSRFLEYRKKDYSAITTWAETEDLEEAERLAGEYVAARENLAGTDATDELWKRINAATKETLRFQYEHQMLSKQQYSDISKMMKFYVPMRGFAEDTAEDLFNYYVTAQSNDFQATLLNAKGRTTMYEGPLGNIGAMHSSAISQGIKNEAKLSLLDAVRRRKDNTIATVTRAWFVKNGQKDANGKDIYEVAYPQIPEGSTFSERQAIIEQFENDMADAKSRGDAFNAHREVDLHGGVVAFEREAHKNEHIVTVREGGKEYGIIINGNPAAAQAINGVRRTNGAGEKFLGIMRNWTRFLSSMFTTFSVPFWVSNFQRDHGQGLTNAFIRNTPGYVGAYIKNRMRAAKLFPLILGKETMDKALANGDAVAALYKQYLENGGPMGQNRIEDNEYFERQMKRYLDNSTRQGVIKGATAVLDVIGGVGEAIETITRFATFMTSMEFGRPIHESISDAKEISTNFARKGSGRSFSRDELDRMTHADGRKLTTLEKHFVNAVSIGVEICRATIPFFNAAVQGLENKVTNYREHTGKTLLADSVYLMLGLGMNLLLANAGGDDDKEKYSHTSDYLRRNNILNPLGNGVYAKWALPQEYRVMYAMGDILGSAIRRERPIEDLGADAFGALMQLSPIGAVTDEVAFSPENKKKEYETLITNVSPGVVAPVLESIFNMDFKGARIYNEGFNENLRAYPGWTKALPTTGKEYVAMAKFLNELTGGNDVERGWVNINPAIVEHLVESYFSGPYQIVVRAPEAAIKAVKGEATVRDIPLLNRIVLNTNDNQRDAFYSNMYYYFKEANTEAERIHSEYKGRPKEGKVAEFYKSKDYQYMLVFNKYDKAERELRKASKLMDEKGDKEAKKGYDDRLQDIQYRIARECLDIYFDR